MTRRPLVIDLCCGLGGWAEGFLAHGWEVIGFDIEPLPYPGLLVIQDVLTLEGSRFRGADLIVASPPCQEFSRLDQPWGLRRSVPDLSLVNACYRIAREAGVPLILENVRGAIPFLGKPEWRYGSQYLWGDGVPLLRPQRVPLGSGKKNCTGYYGARRQAQLRARIPFLLASFIAANS